MGDYDDESENSKSVTDTKVESEARSQEAMSRHGKNDLLRLLSSLEGELQAQDILIDDLKTRLSCISLVKERYYHHSLNDPFSALLRDENTFQKNNLQNQTVSSQKFIEPLPLLDKIATKIKNQQNKVRQHLALSDAYYNLVNRELFEVKKKYEIDTAFGDNVTAALEKERENLKLQIRVEQAKTKKVETDYKNVLQLVNGERQKYKLIITMLLEERQNSSPKLVETENLTTDELKVKYQELFVRNQTLEAQVEQLKQSQRLANQELNHLKFQLLKQQGNFFDSGLPFFESDNVMSPHDCVNISTVDNNNVSCINSHSVVVRHNSSVTEVKNSSCGVKNTQFPSRSVNHSNFPAATHEKLSIHGSDIGIKLSSCGIVSSPTSGASNFALNSPNQPSKNHTFTTPALPAKTRRSNSSLSNSFQASKQKFQKFTNPKPSPPTTNKSESIQSARHTKLSSDPSPRPSADEFLFVSSSSNTSGKSLTRKTQPHKPFKVDYSRLTKDDCKETNKTTVCPPPPLPPKKPSTTVRSNSAKISSTRLSKENDNTNNSKMTDVHPPLSSDNKHQRSTHHRPASASLSGRPNNHSNGSKLTRNRPSSLNINNCNNRNLNRSSSAGPSIHHSLSAQQRLFPPQDGSDGQLLSPITKTVPKSPLESCMFQFK